MGFYMKLNIAINLLPVFACHPLLTLAQQVQNWAPSCPLQCHQRLFSAFREANGNCTGISQQPPSTLAVLTSWTHIKCNWGDQNFSTNFSSSSHFTQEFLPYVEKTKLRQCSIEACSREKSLIRNQFSISNTELALGLAWWQNLHHKCPRPA